MATLEKGNKKLLNAWAFYDWANSVYSLVISTAVFPIYYSSMTASFANVEGDITFLGTQWNPTTLYTVNKVLLKYSETINLQVKIRF